MMWMRRAQWLAALATAAWPLAGAGAGLAVDAGQAALGCGLRGAVLRGPGLALAAPALAAQPGQPVQAGELLRTEYRADDWTGRLLRSAVWSSGASGLSLQPERWDAAAQLEAMPAAARRIYTASAGQTVPFEWAALSAEQRSALGRSPALPGAQDGLGPERLAYLRGERSREGNPFRRRGSLLGASVHSAPLYVGAAAVRPDVDGYAAFREQTLLRPPAVYLGANDGMLHAFDFTSGRELFAYIPDALFGELNLLASPAFQPRAYIDGPLFAGDARIGGSWRSVLLGALGGGGPGLFALDISDPLKFGPAQGALWEFTQKDDAAMGMLTTPAQIARLREAAPRSGARYRYFAVAGNGWNGAGSGALFLLALDKPAGEAWQLNRNYYRLDLPDEGPNGLGAPALVGDADRLLYAYAGDLRGRVWRFSFQGHAPWRGSGVLLFRAHDAQGRSQPITQQPRVAYAPGGGYLILFGTGQLLSRADRVQLAGQSYYAVFDDPDGDAAPSTLTRGDLLPRHAGESAGVPDFDITGRSGSIGRGGARGWYLDFAQSGERSLTAATLRDGKLLFTTVIPGPGPCDGSASRSYQLDVLAGLASDADGTVRSGERTGRELPDFIDTPPLLLPPERSVRREPTGRMAVHKSTRVVQFGAETTEPSESTLRAILPAGRLSWREVANWRELHRAAGRPP
ncbi:pilus assembly protein [Massilia endophytica]|uniref:pilus assembly protein n=1 Tax=Massilia endophytica TaxID=2899220 RepID=UPI001E2B3E9B|nr:PilC/PilY family type IV pilus protein [Massilia endophytica]UGQ47793.1 pilus assembly protein PilY [Massilia endophytica]